VDRSRRQASVRIFLHVRVQPVKRVEFDLNHSTAATFKVRSQNHRDGPARQRIYSGFQRRGASECRSSVIVWEICHPRAQQRWAIRRLPKPVGRSSPSVARPWIGRRRRALLEIQTARSEAGSLRVDFLPPIFMRTLRVGTPRPAEIWLRQRAATRRIYERNCEATMGQKLSRDRNNLENRGGSQNYDPVAVTLATASTPREPPSKWAPKNLLTQPDLPALAGERRHAPV